MATYNITKSDGTAGPAIPDAASPDTQTDLQLVGQNAVSYGLDVAQSFYFLLENFAKDTAPAVGGVIGQLWYDKGGISGTPALNYWSGSVWKPMASTVVGVSADSMSRWDNTAKAWTEETQLTLSAAGVLTILDAGLTDSVSFSHDGTDFNIVGTLTADINVTGVTAVNMPSLTLVTALADTEGGTGTDTYATGDILFASAPNTLSKLTAGLNGEVLELAGGVPTWAASGAAVSVLDDLTDVTAVGAATGSILVKSAGDWIVATGLSYNDGTNDLTVTNIEGIAAANLIDRSAPGTLAATIFSGNITAQANILLGDNDKAIFGTGSDVAVDFDSASGDFDIVATTAIDFNVTGFSGGFRVAAPIFSTGGGEMKVLGTTSISSTNVGFVSVNHADDLQTQIRMGTRSGSSFSEVNALDDDLNLYASNTLVFNIDPIQTTITEGGVSAMNWHAVSGTNTTSSAGVFDDGGTERNVGYNETPEVVVSTSFTIDANDIGKFLSRTAAISRVITLSAETDIPIGGSFLAHNDHITGTLTIATTQILEWIDGSGSAPSTGTRTVAYNSIVTIRKKSSTVWQIWGNGIS